MARKHDNQQESLHQHVPQQTELPDRHSDPQSESSLPSLPIEILEMIAAELDNDGLKSMRATCRAMYDSSTDEFAERHTSSNVEILTTHKRTVMRKLTVTLRSPNLVKAQAARTQLLVLHDPLDADERRRPGETSISNTVTSNPDAWTFLQQRNYRQTHGHCLAPLIFERVADLPPQTTNLRRLNINGADLDGDALIDIFETHKHSLRVVTLCRVILTKLLSYERALSRTKTRCFTFEDLEVRNTLGHQLDVTKDHTSFPKFKKMMHSKWKWELRAGSDWSLFIYERKSDTS